MRSGNGMKTRRLDVLTLPLEGLQLVEANAGTGKTYAIQHLYLRLLLEGENPPGVREILVVTFTEAAAAELRERIRGNIAKALTLVEGSGDFSKAGRELGGILEKQRLPESGAFDPKKALLLKRALLDFDEAAVSTIHGFCSRTLSENAFESGAPFDAKLSEEADAQLERFVKDFWRRCCYPKGNALLAAVMERLGIDAASLLAFARGIPDPAIELLPAEADFDLDALKARLDEVKRLWLAEAGAIIKLLSDSKEISKAASAYCDGNLKRHAARLSLYAEGRAPVPFDSFEFLSKSEIDASVTAARKKKGLRGPDHPLFSLCDEMTAALPGCAVALKLRLARELGGGAVRRLKSQAGVMSFDDLLLDLDMALSGPKGEALRAKLAARYKAVLIDEFQDTDPVQYRIFDSAFGGGSNPLFLIGDPKQSIYAFRRADVFSYEKVKQGNAPLALAVNHRSTKELVEAVNRIFAFDDASARRPFALTGGWLEYEPSDSAGAQAPLSLDGSPVLDPMRVIYMESGERPLGAGEAEILAIEDSASRIAALLAKAREGKALLHEGARPRALEASDIAVLVDSNFNARRVKEALQERGVPAVLQRSSDVFKSAEAVELRRALAAAATPSDPALVKAALRGPLFGVPPARLAAFLDEGEGLSEFLLWLEYFDALRRTWERSGLVAALSSLLDVRPALFFEDAATLPPEMELTVKGRLLSGPGGERAVANLRQIAEHLIASSQAARLDPAGQISLLSRLIAEDSADEARECRLESDEDAVRVMTVHKSKGLQFPVVFAPLLWRRGAPEKIPGEFRFHDARGDMKLCLDPAAGEGSVEAFRLESFSEQIRLVYVALTRASRLCVVHSGNIAKASRSALAHLLGDRSAPLESFLAKGGPTPTKDSIGALLGPFGSVEAPLRRATRLTSAVNSLRESSFSAREFKDFSKRVDNSRGVLSFSELAFHIKSSALYEPEAPASSGEDAESAARLGRLMLTDFKPGALAGECIHKFLELFDLSLFKDDPARAETEGLALAGECVEDFGLAGTPGSAANELLSKRLPRQLLDFGRALAYLELDGVDSTFTLASLPKASSARELEFDFAVRRPLREGDLNALLHEHGFEGARKRLGREFENLVASLPLDAATASVPCYIKMRDFTRRSGVMNGKADFVFEAGGRYHLIDWKSNYLGPSPEDYAPARLLADLVARDYVLQYHIYALALHLHLSRTLEGYEFERHFGNILYVYARGAGAGGGLGVYVDRPSRALMDALRELFLGKGGA